MQPVGVAISYFSSHTLLAYYTDRSRMMELMPVGKVECDVCGQPRDDLEIIPVSWALEGYGVVPRGETEAYLLGEKK